VQSIKKIDGFNIFKTILASTEEAVENLVSAVLPDSDFQLVSVSEEVLPEVAPEVAPKIKIATLQNIMNAALRINA